MAQSWQMWAVLSAIFAAMTAIFAKLGVQTINPDLATLLRTALLVPLVALLVTMTGQWQSLLGVRPQAFGLLALSAFATGASWVCYFRALKIGDAARVAPIDKLSVVLVAIFAVLFLGEKLTATGWIGILLIFTGIVLVALK